MTRTFKDYLWNENALCILGIILTLAFAVYYISDFNLWMDVDHYWRNINDWFVDGKIPYKDYVFEYPPLSLVIFLIPRLFSWDLDSFHYAYAIFCCITYVLTSVCILKMIEDEKVRRYAMIILILIPIFAIRFIVTRNDIFALAGMVFAIYSMKIGKPWLAYVIIAIATMVKIYPIVLLLPIIAYHFSKKDYRAMMESIVVTALVCLLIQIPFFILDPNSSFAYLGYHGNRNIQIESVIASVMDIAYALGLTDLQLDTSSGSDNIVGWLPDLVSPFMNYVLLLGVFIAFILLIRRSRTISSESDTLRLICIGSAFVTLTFVTLNKVYSAQYMIWVLGLLPLVLMYVKDEKARRLGFILTLAFGFLSMIAAEHYDGHRFTQPLFITLEILKNSATVIMLIYCFKMLFHDDAEIKNESSER